MTAQMIKRAAAAEKTLARFKGLPFQFGRHDCARMTAAHLRGCGVQVTGFAKAGSYSTLLGARRALQRAGHPDLPAVLDALALPRIAPAAALVGDIVALPAEDDLGCLAICLGNGRVLGWHPDAEGAAVLQPLEFVAAWRVPL